MPKQGGPKAPGIKTQEQIRTEGPIGVWYEHGNKPKGNKLRPIKRGPAEWTDCGNCGAGVKYATETCPQCGSENVEVSYLCPKCKDKHEWPDEAEACCKRSGR